MELIRKRACIIYLEDLIPDSYKTLRDVDWGDIKRSSLSRDDFGLMNLVILHDVKARRFKILKTRYDNNHGRIYKDKTLQEFIKNYELLGSLDS